MYSKLIILLCVFTKLVHSSGCTENQTVINVFANGGSSTCQNEKDGLHCPNLDSAFFHVTNISNNVCIVITYNPSHVTRLENPWKFSNLISFTLTAYNSNVEVSCNETTGAGFAFYNSDNIFFSKVRFRYCGAIRNVGNVTLKTAFHFENVTNLKLYELNIYEHHGYAATLYDVGGKVIFNHTVIENFLTKTGAGVHIEYSGLDQQSSNNHIIITNAWFRKLKMIKGSNDTSKPFGKGTLSFIFRNNSFGNIIYINSSHFLNNNATWGGAIYIQFLNQSRNNHISITSNIRFTNNTANKYGGAIAILYMGNHNSTGNFLTLEELFMVGNSAPKGGGLFIWRSVHETKDEDTIYLSYCTFKNNAAEIGSDIFGVQSTINISTLYRTEFSENKEYQNKTPPLGSIAIYGCILNINAIVTVSHNLNTGILLENSIIAVHGKLNLSENNGINGGGVAMYGRSEIKLFKTSELGFWNNKALLKGGAMFVYIPAFISYGKTKYKLRNCFFTYKLNNNITVTFSNNNASNNGNAVFASSLSSCTRESKNLKDVLTNWTGFNLSCANETHCIVTDPISINITAINWSNKAPGIYFKPKVTLFDQRNNSINSNVEINIDSRYNISIKHSQYIVKDEGFEIAFVGKPNKTFNVTLSTSLTVSRVIPFLKLYNCPQFHTYESGKCNCIKQNLTIGFSRCNLTEIYLYKNFWVPGNASIAYECPQGYCKLSKNHSDILYKKENQCAKGRDNTSRLCSQCKPTYAVTYSSDTCQDCSTTTKYSFILTIIITILLDIIITLVIIVLNRKSYASYINPVIYSYKIIECYQRDLNLNSNIFLSAIISTFTRSSNADGIVPSICFTSDLNNLTKLWMYFGSSFTLVFGFLINFWLFHKKKLIPFIDNAVPRDAYYRSLNTLVFIFYFEISYFAFRTLHYTKIVTNTEVNFYVFVYAKEKYWHGEHIAIASVAVVTLFILLLYLILLLINSTSVNRTNMCSGMFFAAWILPVLTNVKNGYKTSNKMWNDRTWFAPLYLIFFTVFFTIGEFWEVDGRVFMLNIVCLIWLTSFILLMPYKNEKANLFEVFLLGNIVVIGIIIDGLEGMYEVSTYSKTLVSCLMYIPIVSGLLFWIIPFVLTACGIVINCSLPQNKKEGKMIIPPPGNE